MRIFVFLGFILTAVVFVNSAALEEDDEGGLSPMELQYLNDLNDYIEEGRLEKRGRKFCLRRDMTCPNRDDKRDFCCRGSQCACNIFGQNCRCSSLGLFQRLGKRWTTLILKRRNKIVSYIFEDIILIIPTVFYLMLLYFQSPKSINTRTKLSTTTIYKLLYFN